MSIKKMRLPEYAEFSMEIHNSCFDIKPITFWTGHPEYLHSGLDTQNRELKVNFLSLQMFPVHQATVEGKPLF